MFWRCFYLLCGFWLFLFFSSYIPGMQVLIINIKGSYRKCWNFVIYISRSYVVIFVILSPWSVSFYAFILSLIFISLALSIFVKLSFFMLFWWFCVCLHCAFFNMEFLKNEAQSSCNRKFYNFYQVGALLNMSLSNFYWHGKAKQ